MNKSLQKCERHLRRANESKGEMALLFYGVNGGKGKGTMHDEYMGYNNKVNELAQQKGNDELSLPIRLYM